MNRSIRPSSDKVALVIAYQEINLYAATSNSLNHKLLAKLSQMMSDLRKAVEMPEPIRDFSAAWGLASGLSVRIKHSPITALPHALSPEVVSRLSSD